jgi:predicted nucleotide-binding protein
LEKAKKLEIINEIIERAKNCTYDSDGRLTKCRDDIKAFIRRTDSIDKDLIKRIDDIKYNPIFWTTDTPKSTFVECWNIGKDEFVSVLSSIANEIKLYDDDNLTKSKSINTNKIFIVHGHNETMKLAVKDVINSLGLTPIILHEQPNKGRTIIEKFERLSEDVGFAIVLLSADDEMINHKFQARQNVILELGYFVAKLGRENVVALYDTSREVVIPSDISGVLYEPYESANGAWRTEVVQELKAAGYDVDANKLIKV